MKRSSIYLLMLLFMSCATDPETYLEHINGYWEIESVTFEDGSQRDYKYNATIDYLSINDSLKGFRKKLKPNFSGSFETSQDVEYIRASIENDSLHLYYNTVFSQWKETVLNANTNQLTLINSAKAIYTYKRYHPLELD